MRFSKTLTALAMWSGAALLLLAGCGPSVSTNYSNSSGSASNTGSTGGTLTGLGYTWGTGSSGTTNPFRSLAFGNGRWVAVGNGIIAESTDGKSWTLTPVSASNYYFLGNVSFGNNTFVAVSELGIQTSTDGISWSQATVNATTSSGGSPLPQQITAAAYGNGKWVAVDNLYLTNDGFGIWTSTDNGATWNVTMLNGSYKQPTSITYGNGTFVIAGYAGLLLTSPDGANWTDRSFTTGQSMMGITYANGEFVAVANDGEILTATDATGQWTSTTVSVNGFNAIGYGGGIFLAVGSVSGASAYVSTDGKSWTDASSYLPTAIKYSSLYGAAYGNSAFVVVGDAGAVGISP